MKGFIDLEALPQATRRTAINTSDLIHVIMEVPGVRAVSTISVSTGDETEAWTLRLDPDKAPKLDLRGSEIQLEKKGSGPRSGAPTRSGLRDGGSTGPQSSAP